jgi:hypothetical protein
MQVARSFTTGRIVMATNLVSLIMQFLTPDIIARIAATLGLGRTETQAGVSAAVPALLAAFSGVADKPGGSQTLVDAIKNQSGVLDSVISMVGGGSPSSLVEKGSNLLSSLIGSRDHSALAGAVGKFAGIGQSTGSSLIGMLGPVVMGVIGKQIGWRGLDAGSVSGLLCRGRKSCWPRSKRDGRTGGAVCLIRQPLSRRCRPTGRPCRGTRHAKLDLLGDSRPPGWRTSLLSVRKGSGASCPADDAKRASDPADAVAASEASDRRHGATRARGRANGASSSKHCGRRPRYWKAAW